MTRSDAVPRGRTPVRRRELLPALDYPLLFAVAFLLGLGFVMVTSASMPIGAQAPFHNPLHYVIRHLIACVLALGIGALCFATSMTTWQRISPLLLIIGILLLVVVLIPGVGHTVNGATRWIRLGPISLQISELVKVFAMLYVAGYLVRRQHEVSTQMMGFLPPMLFIGIACALIMVQPDFGTAAVILATVLGLLFLGGVPLFHFAVLIGLVGLALVALIVLEPYRLARITSFMHPFSDPFNSGYQLSQALIAFGRGEWFGVGLGNGIQKQYFLPEAHTDFLLAVIAEELGFLGVLTVIGTFIYVVVRTFRIGERAYASGALFSAYVAHGVGLLLGLQAFISAGVNTGLLPTKGLTLPFMSYGTNSVIAATMAIALVLRIDYELRSKAVPIRPMRGSRWVRA